MLDALEVVLMAVEAAWNLVRGVLRFARASYATLAGKVRGEEGDESRETGPERTVERSGDG